ncbi:MAG: hypothetical protein JXA82_11380 [Sedimentisphaerales bacterium]|nr:hypothetical protein [Sedimentisphaerales bacterium]
MSKPLTNIIFTRNRPLQLAAYLESFLQSMGPAVHQVYIIYKEDLFDEEYTKVFSMFPQCRIVREQEFHQDFMCVFEQVETQYVIFATDDVVYFDSVDFSVINATFEQRRDIFGFTLKFGPDYFSDGKEPIFEDRIGDHTVYKVNWKKAMDLPSKYPFELNSTIYRTSLVRKILHHIGRDRTGWQRAFAEGTILYRLGRLFFSRKRLYHAFRTFYDPNNLEGYGYRWCRSHKWQLSKYLYFQKICATTLQVNRVNTVVDNPVYGTDEHAVETLNAKFQQGYRLNLDFLQKNKPSYCRVGKEYFQLTKTD